eukprot:comp22194_c2_seq1/m.32619 comp22194_c2_seq1/g.32619  ORF comp22194_c2_seq1/g.32619 comp22194_c2_seq1/m.32619 type:complete len:673 (-) comp22194_c2_seq1:522-2540(-)
MADIQNHSDDHEVVAILDAGAQYAKVIDRKVRELKVRSELLPLETPVANLKGRFKAVIISGGPSSVYAEDAPKPDPELFNLDVPILGICYGMQLMNLSCGGTVVRKEQREDGQHPIDVDTTSPLFDGLEPTQPVLLTHGDSVGDVAPDCKVLARSSGDIIAAIQHNTRPLYGVQFHPEVDLTVNGKEIMANFLFKCAGCKGNYSMESRESTCIREIQEQAGEKKVLVLVSGGVDSSVCAALLSKALGPERVIALHIDNGFMRKRESALVKDSLQALGLQLRVEDASETFYNSTTFIGKDEKRYETAKLKETAQPEEKRKIIGDTFMKVGEQVIREYNLDPEQVYLAQGTLRPDLIESASETVSKKADAIKTHHNDTELVRVLRARGRVIEPLKDYHKDEVRELGTSLGLPEELVHRQPFPGPGLAIRVICAVEPYICADFENTQKFVKDIVRYGLGDSTEATATKVTNTLGNAPSACLKGLGLAATLLPIKTVGVQGDGRTYSYVCALSLLDGSSPTETQWEGLFLYAKVIPRLCHNINRVVYVFGSSVEGPITAITPTLLTVPVLDQLREADSIVNHLLWENELTRALSQVPVISFPIDFDSRGSEPTTKRSIAIRTFITSDFMTGVPARPGKEMPIDVLQSMVDRIQQVPDISRVVYDMTAKPPGTTEWE